MASNFDRKIIEYKKKEEEDQFNIIVGKHL